MGTDSILTQYDMSNAFKKLIPALNRVLIKKADPITKTKSGLILSQAETTNIGTVVAVGPGNLSDAGKRIPLEYSVGATVLLPDFGGQTVELADGEYHLFRDADLLGELKN